MLIEVCLFHRVGIEFRSRCLSQIWKCLMAMNLKWINVGEWLNIWIIISFKFGLLQHQLNNIFYYHFSDVKELVQECVGGADLQQQKSQIQTFSEQTSSALKRHVYANYMQFIETAKEISRMTQLWLYMHLKWPQNIIAYLSAFNFRFGVGNVSIITFADRTTKYSVNVAWTKFSWRFQGRFTRWLRWW